MDKLKSFIADLTIFLIILLIVFSIVGAFAGAERAKELFNSLPLKIFWILWLLIAISGLIIFRKLRNKLGLFLTHISIVLILVGSILSSQTGHNLWQKFTGKRIIRQGAMVIFEGTKENRVIVQPGNRIEKLPFYIKLVDFRIVYYKPEYNNISAENGYFHRMPDIKEYISAVQIIKNNKVILTNNIRVNHPLHFGGYHFYQMSYDEKMGRYTVLLVVSDLGFGVVRTGYILLAIGVVWLFYVKELIIFLRKRRNGNQI